MSLDARNLVPLAEAAAFPAVELIQKIMDEQGIDDKFAITLKIKRAKKGAQILTDINVST